jgi:hypothetical protein
VPVLGEDHVGESPRQPIDHRHHLVTAGDRQRAAGAENRSGYRQPGARGFSVGTAGWIDFSRGMAAGVHGDRRRWSGRRRMRSCPSRAARFRRATAGPLRKASTSFAISLETVISPLGHHFAPRSPGSPGGTWAGSGSGSLSSTCLSTWKKRIAAKRRLPGEHLVESRTKRENVGPGGRRDRRRRIARATCSRGVPRAVPAAVVSGRNFPGDDLRQSQVGEFSPGRSG